MLYYYTSNNFVSILYFRWLSLAESAVYLNSDKQGDANGLISSDVAPSGDRALFIVDAIARDGDENEQLLTRNNISWVSSSSWNTAGDISLNTLFSLVDVINWDAQAHFMYAENMYYGYLNEQENGGEQELFTYVKGNYQGSWTDW